MDARASGRALLHPPHPPHPPLPPTIIPHSSAPSQQQTLLPTSTITTTSTLVHNTHQPPSLAPTDSRRCPPTATARLDPPPPSPLPPIPPPPLPLLPAPSPPSSSSSPVPHTDEVEMIPESEAEDDEVVPLSSSTAFPLPLASSVKASCHHCGKERPLECCWQCSGHGQTSQGSDDATGHQPCAKVYCLTCMLQHHGHRVSKSDSEESDSDSEESKVGVRGDSGVTLGLPRLSGRVQLRHLLEEEQRVAVDDRLQPSSARRQPSSVHRPLLLLRRDGGCRATARLPALTHFQHELAGPPQRRPARGRPRLRQRLRHLSPSR